VKGKGQFIEGGYSVKATARFVVGSLVLGLGVIFFLTAATADTPPVASETKGVHSSEALAASSFGNGTQVNIFFTDRLRPPTAENPANFTISPGIAVQSADYDRHKYIVTLTVSPGLAEGTEYSLRVDGVKDQTGNPVEAVDLPLDFVAIPAEGLALWLRADRHMLADADGKVFTWGDISANRNDLLSQQGHEPTWQDAIGFEPAAVNFSGETERLWGDKIHALNTTTLSWCVVFQAADATRPQVLLRGAYASGAKHESMDMWGVSLDGGAVASHARDRKGGKYAAWSPVIERAWLNFTTIWSAPDLSAWLDGAPAGATSGADANPKANRWLVLGGAGEDDNGFTGAVSEIIIYSKALTVEERQAVENYLAVKYPADADGDNLLDWWERKYFGNLTQGPNDDPDDDGLTNIREYELGTNPNNPDTDGDQMPDGWEVNFGLNPLANDAYEDLDDDGVANFYEYRDGLDPRDPNNPGLLILHTSWPDEGEVIR
jgi:concanavalin A-like lectin/glucanase superfamily protein